jgi:hypothetical protein
MYIFVDEDRMDPLQVAGIRRLLERVTRHTHTIDVKIRADAKETWYQADWLKHAREVLDNQGQTE